MLYLRNDIEQCSVFSQYFDDLVMDFNQFNCTYHGVILRIWSRGVISESLISPISITPHADNRTPLTITPRLSQYQVYESLQLGSGKLP